MKPQIKSVQEMMRGRGILPYGQVQCMIDREVMRRCDALVPKGKTQRLRGSVYRMTAVGSGAVIYCAPYARRHYYNTGGVDALGRRYGPSRFASGNDLWFERMKAKNTAGILQAAALLAGARERR